jgi:hypothetical protein
VLHALVEVVDGDGPAGELVEVELLDLLGVGGHLDRLDQHRLGGGRGGMFMGLGCHVEVVYRCDCVLRIKASRSSTLLEVEMVPVGGSTCKNMQQD